MDMPRLAQALIAAFPNLSGQDFGIVEQPSEEYNCIAYAAGDVSEPWDYNANHYWPPWATRDSRIESLIEVFTGLSYELCDGADLEDGYLKVALYESQGESKHAAAQMPNGRWRSKMGEGPVIEHRSPESLAGGMYGGVHCFMRRPV